MLYNKYHYEKLSIIYVTFSFFVHQAGRYIHIEDPAKLRSAMASYYDFFSDGQELEEVVFTVPYYDAFGIGQCYHM